jgi:C4-dicarboxylate transporter
MSPVAAVTLMCAELTETDPIELFKRVLPAVLAGLAAMVALAVVLAR